MTIPMLMSSGLLGFAFAMGAALGMGSVVRARRQVQHLTGENARLAAAVEVDPLTGLANRRGVRRCLETALAQPHTFTAVLYLDLDHFKWVNDQHGHPCGDRVLMTVADRLRELLPVDACAGRMGGDELLVVIPSTASLADAVEHAATLRSSLSRPIPVGDSDDHDETVALTVSIGVASVHTGDGNSSTVADDLIERADQALRRAKESGRDRVTAAVVT